eukprot:493977_1
MVNQTLIHFLVALPLFICLTQLNVIMSTNISNEEIDGLKDIYYALNGANWTNKWDITQINNSINICQQYGVNCSATNQIISIHFEPNNMKGTIPETIGVFLNLTTLIFHHNYDINGSIPHTIGNLTLLTNLDL